VIVRHNAPVGRAQGGDPGAVDRVVVLADLVAVEQAHGVADVRLVDLDGRELRQQQLGAARWGIEHEPVAKGDLVAHPEHMHEEVDVAVMVLVEVEPALVGVHRVEGEVGLAAGPPQDLVGRARPFLGRGEGEVLGSRSSAAGSSGARPRRAAPAALPPSRRIREHARPRRR
jgi:hypothetical protein